MESVAMSRNTLMINEHAPKLYEAAQLGDADKVRKILEVTKGELPDYVYRRALNRTVSSHNRRNEAPPSQAVVDALLVGPYGKRLPARDLGPLVTLAAKNGHDGIVRTLANRGTGNGSAAHYLGARAYAAMRGKDSLASFLKEKADAELKPYYEIAHALDYINAAKKRPGDPEAEIQDTERRLQQRITQVAAEIGRARLRGVEAHVTQKIIRRIRSKLAGLLYQHKDAILVALDEKVHLPEVFLGEHAAREQLFNDVNELVDILVDLDQIVWIDIQLEAELGTLASTIASLKGPRWPLRRGQEVQKAQEALDWVGQFLTRNRHIWRKRVLDVLEARARPDGAPVDQGLPPQLSGRLATLKMYQEGPRR